MKIEAFLAARTEPRRMRGMGFHVWSSVLYVEGTMTWTDVRYEGRLPQVSFPVAQHRGALAVLQKLAALSKDNPEAGVRFESDSQVLIQELKGDAAVQRDPRCEPLIEESRGLVLWLEPVLTLRYCHFRDNAIAHEMISQYCKKHWV